MSQELLFVALLFPQNIAQEITQLKQYCAEQFHTKKALNSPPHITLQPPFKIDPEAKTAIAQYLQTTAATQAPLPITLQNFNCFASRVLYIDVQPSPELQHLQAQLKNDFATQFYIKDRRYGDRPFHPHVTIAFKDLTKLNFDRAWAEFQNRTIFHQLITQNLTLLRYTAHQWQIDQHFPLQTSPSSPTAIGNN